MPPPGVARLSELEVDVDKDWNRRNIVNFGPGGIDLYSTVTSHASRHRSGGADPLFPADYSVLPSADNAYDLGSSSYRWRTLYAVTVYGALISLD